jgi:RimJ/RimL family protein N-acetyltransferase
MGWLAPSFSPPAHVALATGHHLRPIRSADVLLDFPAVMESQASLWTMFGARWGWPPPTLTIDQDLTDLARHEREMESRESFNYCILDEGESQLLGCVYIDPPEEDSPVGVDAEICWWVIDAAVGTQLEGYLDTFIPDWIHEAWPFRRPRLDLWWRESGRSSD